MDSFTTVNRKRFYIKTRPAQQQNKQKTLPVLNFDRYHNHLECLKREKVETTYSKESHNKKGISIFQSINYQMVQDDGKPEFYDNLNLGPEELVILSYRTVSGKYFNVITFWIPSNLKGLSLTL